jgi:hypothetical protein
MMYVVASFSKNGNSHWVEVNMYAPVHHVLALTTIVRERLLPVNGQVLARVNQRVSPGDVVADAAWGREHIFLDVARTLKVSPKNADKFIKVKDGDRVTAGMNIAEGRGLFAPSIRAPRDGRVVLTGNGQVLIEVAQARFELKAGMPGNVIQVIDQRGVVVQSVGALIQGVWGNGRVDTGSLVNLAEKPDAVLTADQLDVSLRGSIILSGICKDAETLQAASEVPVRGLILSSLFPSLIPLAREMKYPILLTDGFGSIPMNSAAHRLLTTNAKRDTTVNAEIRNRYTGAQPEIVIPLPVTQEPAPPNDVELFSVGQQVRMRRPPLMGGLGSIIALKPGLTVLPSGLRAQAADVKLENGENVTVPLVNLEVVG